PLHLGGAGGAGAPRQRQGRLRRSGQHPLSPARQRGALADVSGSDGNGGVSLSGRGMRPEGGLKGGRRGGVGLAGLLLAGQGGGAQDKDKPKKAPAKEPQFKGKPLSHWTKALKGKDVLARVEALNVLSQAGPEAKAAVPALLGVFRDTDAPYLHPLAAVAL